MRPPFDVDVVAAGLTLSFFGASFTGASVFTGAAFKAEFSV